MKKKGKVMIALGAILLLCSIGLMGYNLYDAARAQETAGVLLETIESSIDIQPPTDNIPRKDVDTKEEMPAIEIDGLRYIGIIELPSLSLSLPVFEDWSYDLLKQAPCRYSGSVYRNDMVICAHNYRGHFGVLNRAAIGSEVIFTAVNGETYRYIVSNRETLQPSEHERMIESSEDWDLTLFTCFVGGRTRCTLRCVLETE